MTPNRSIIGVGGRRSRTGTIQPRHRRGIDGHSHRRGNRGRAGSTQHYRMSRRVWRWRSLSRRSRGITIAARIRDSRRAVRCHVFIVHVTAFLILIKRIGVRGHWRITQMSLESLLVNAHRAWCVLRKRDHAGIAPNVRVTGWGPEPGSPAWRTLCSDDFALVSEDETACLNTTSSVSLRSGGLHLRLRRGFRRHVAAGEAPAEPGKEGHGSNVERGRMDF